MTARKSRARARRQIRCRNQLRISTCRRRYHDRRISSLLIIDIAFMRRHQNLATFDIDEKIKRSRWLRAPNPHGRPNSDLIRAMAERQRRCDETTAPHGHHRFWTRSYARSDCALYEAPISSSSPVYVKPQRDKNKRAHRCENWWLHAEHVLRNARSAIGLADDFSPLSRVSKHQILRVDRTPSSCRIDAIYRLRARR